MLLGILVINSQDDFGILVHFLMRLSNNESFFSLSRKDQEFNSLFLSSLSLAVVSNHLCTLWQLTLSSEDMLGFIRVAKIVQIKSNDIFPIIGSLIELLSFFEVSFGFLGFGNHDEDRWGGNLVH